MLICWRSTPLITHVNSFMLRAIKGVPSECRNLVVTSTSDRDVVIQWNRPRIVGERYFYYNIYYSDLNRPRQFITHNTNFVNSNSKVMYRVTNLIPYQKYRLRVTTHNNISDMSTGRYIPKYCEVTASTLQRGECLYNRCYSILLVAIVSSWSGDWSEGILLSDCVGRAHFNRRRYPALSVVNSATKEDSHSH